MLITEKRRDLSTHAGEDNLKEIMLGLVRVTCQCLSITTARGCVFLVWSGSSPRIGTDRVCLVRSPTCDYGQREKTSDLLRLGADFEPAEERAPSEPCG